MHSPTVMDKGDTKQRQRSVSAVKVILLQIKDQQMKHKRKYYHFMMHSRPVMDKGDTKQMQRRVSAVRVNLLQINDKRDEAQKEILS